MATNPAADMEITAMQSIAGALEGLDAEATGRVLRWAAERFGQGAGIQPPFVGNSPTTTTDVDVDDRDASDYSNYHELIDAAEPQTGLDRILVTAYWFQVIEGLDSFESFQVNRELKHLGHPSANITRDLGKLRKRRLVLQVKKKGSTQQARKEYRLTREGIKAVETMVRDDEE
jgi:hypothetical protein